MAYDTQLSDRVRAALGPQTGLTEKKMFGGIGFMINGNMACGVHADELILRLAVADTEATLKKPHTRSFDMSGRPMRGWVLVHADGLKTEAALKKWMAIGVSYATSLPAK